MSRSRRRSTRRSVAAGCSRVIAPLLVMLSGGQDSTCLLDVAVSLLGPVNVGALHVNYGLRAQADDDERHCRALCEGLDVPLEVLLGRQARAPRAMGRRPAETCRPGHGMSATPRPAAWRASETR